VGVEFGIYGVDVEEVEVDDGEVGKDEALEQREVLGLVEVVVETMVMTKILDDVDFEVGLVEEGGFENGMEEEEVVKRETGASTKREEKMAVVNVCDGVGVDEEIQGQFLDDREEFVADGGVGEQLREGEISSSTDREDGIVEILIRERRVSTRIDRQDKTSANKRTDKKSVDVDVEEVDMKEDGFVDGGSGGDEGSGEVGSEGHARE
jgi:hypothetical protein